MDQSITADAKYKSFKVGYTTNDGKKFWALVDEEGIKFYDRVSSSGAPEGNPIQKSADDVFSWIEDAGKNKPFGKRKSFQKKRSAGRAAPAKLKAG